MLCKNCGTENGEGNTFCVKCGGALITAQPVENIIRQNVANQNAVNQNAIPPVKKGFDFGKSMRIFGKGFMKPLETIEENKKEYRSPAASFTLAGIVTVISMVLYFFSRILQMIFIKGMKPSMKYLEGFPYMKTLGVGLLLAAGFILVVASVYYIASLIAKKESNYGELVFVGTIATLPLILAISVVAPILSYIWLPLKTATILIAFVYSLLIVTIPVSKTLTFAKEDHKVYFHLICLSIICVTCYFVYVNLINATILNVKQITDGITNIFDQLF